MAAERAGRALVPPWEACAVKSSRMDGADVLDNITAEWLWSAVWHERVQLISANIRRRSKCLRRSFTLCSEQRPYRILPCPTRRET